MRQITSVWQIFRIFFKGKSENLGKKTAAIDPQACLSSAIISFERLISSFFFSAYLVPRILMSFEPKAFQSFQPYNLITLG